MSCCGGCRCPAGSEQLSGRCGHSNRLPMQRLPASVRTALLADAAAASSAITRWSLSSLANINAPLPTEAAAAAICVPPRSDVAEKLLTDVKLRLASQLLRTRDMKAQAEEILGGADDVAQQGSSSNSSGPRIIRAVNQPVELSPKIQVQYDKQSQMEKKSALKNLSDLETLHAGTYQLVHELLDDGAPTLRRFTKADAALVAATFESIRSRNASSVESLADVVIALRKARSLRAGLSGLAVPAGQFCGIDLKLIDNFLRERLGAQLLCDHYVALDKGKPNGGIAVNCSLSDVVEEAKTEALHVCDANLGIMPDVHVQYGMDDESNALIPNAFDALLNISRDITDYDDIHLTLIRPWLHHALVEVLKNSMQSSVQRAIDEDCNNPLPSDVHIRLIDGGNVVYVVVADQGVGLTEEGMRRAFKFADSSSRKRWDRIEEQTSYAMVRQPLGSLGVGLPLSRMMCQMFGGDVMISNRAERDAFKSGCTAVITLPKDESIIENSEISGIVSETNLMPSAAASA